MERETEIQRRKQKQKQTKNEWEGGWEGLEREDGEQTAAER